MNAGKQRVPRRRQGTLERREEILRAAQATFGSKGYKNGSLTEIAEQVNMTHAGVLHHFGSKDQLLLQVLQYRDETDVAELAEKRIPDGIELFRHLVRTAVLNATRPGIVQAYTVLSAESVTDEHPARPFFEERYSTLRAEVEAAFRLACEEGGVTAPATVDKAAAAVLAVMDGLQVQWLLAPDAVDLAGATEFAISAIVSSVLNPQPSALQAR